MQRIQDLRRMWPRQCVKSHAVTIGGITYLFGEFFFKKSFVQHFLLILGMDLHRCVFFQVLLLPSYWAPSFPAPWNSPWSSPWHGELPAVALRRPGGWLSRTKLGWLMLTNVWFKHIPKLGKDVVFWKCEMTLLNTIIISNPKTGLWQHISWLCISRLCTLEGFATPPFSSPKTQRQHGTSAVPLPSVGSQAQQSPHRSGFFSKDWTVTPWRKWLDLVLLKDRLNTGCPSKFVLPLPM